jgi:hypothetical protein
MASTTGIHAPRYRRGETCAILNISTMQLRSLQAGQDSDGSPAGWRSRTLMELYKLMLAIELSTHGLEVAEASTIAHEVQPAWDGATADETHGISLGEQLEGQLFGRTLIAQRKNGLWKSFVHLSDSESRPLGEVIGDSSIVIRLQPLGSRLIARIRQHALGEVA